MSEPTTDIAVPVTRQAQQNLPIGLYVSTGAPKPTRGPGRPIDHFRMKEGGEGQFADAVKLAHEFYGDNPKQLDDVLLLSNRVGDVLDIRIQAWRQGGRSIWGNTNFATIEDRDEFLARMAAWDDECLYFPRTVNDVPARLRDSWQGEPIEFTLDGPDDPRIGKYEMKVSATLRFGLPKALGLGAVALYSTSSRKNIRNLYEGIWFAHRAFEGNVVGVPFRLRVEPRRTQYFHPGDDKEPKGWRSSKNFQVTFTTPFTMQQAIDAIRDRHEALRSGTTPALAAGADTGEFFRSDDRDQIEDNDPPFIPVESFDPEQRDDEETVEDGEYEYEPIEVHENQGSFEDMLPESVRRQS